MHINSALAMSVCLTPVLVSLATLKPDLTSRRLVATLLATSTLCAAALAISKCFGWQSAKWSNELLQVDSLSGLMLVLVSSISLITLTHTCTFLEGDTHKKRFIGLLALLAAVASFLFISANALLLATCWCLTTPLLAALTRHCGTPASLNASSKLIKYHLVSDVLFSLGIILLVAASGSTDIGAINLLSAEHRLAEPFQDIAAILVVSAALIKSAVFPFHGWLFGTLYAPTTFSAFLHAGLINIAGFVGFKFAPVIFASAIAPWFFIAFGLFSAGMGAICSLAQPDVKRKLVFSTVAQMGFMCLQCGLGAFSAALFHLMLHGYFKCYLFLDAGSAITTSKNRQFEVADAGTAYPTLLAILSLTLLFILRDHIHVTAISSIVFAVSLLYEYLRIKPAYTIAPTTFSVQFLIPVVIFVTLYAIGSTAFSSIFEHAFENQINATVMIAFSGFMLIIWSAINARVSGRSPRDWLYVLAINGGYLTHD